MRKFTVITLISIFFISIILYFNSEYKRNVSEPNFQKINFVVFLTAINEEFEAPHDISKYSYAVKLARKGVIIKKYVDKGEGTDQVNLVIYNENRLIDTIHAHFSTFTHVDSLGNIGSYVFYKTNSFQFITNEKYFGLLDQKVLIVPYGAIKVSRTKIKNN